MNSTIPYILAVVSGLAIPFIPETEPVLVVIGLIYAIVGGAFGFFRPKESWRWGLWIAGPMTILTGFSVLFAGQVDIFLEKDLPILLVAMIGACAGGFVFSRFKQRHLLNLGGYLNIMIAILHIVGLLRADAMFEVIGIAEGMALAKQDIHPLYPYAITVVVACLFFIMGLYGRSAAGSFRKLPFLKPVVLCIAGIYLSRGVYELVFDFGWQNATPFLETTYSLIAVFIGLLYLVGGLKPWASA